MKILNTLFNTDSLKESRLPWIDFAKGIAILFVVYRHILVGLNRSGFNFEPIYSSLAEVGLSFRMQLFFIISGIFIRKSILKRTNQKFTADKLKTLIYPYLIWTVIQVTLQIILGGYTNSQRTAIDYLYIIIQPRAIDQFWFIYALFNISILYLLLFRVLGGRKWGLLAIGIALYAVGSYIVIPVLDDVCDYFLFLVIGDLIAEFLLRKESAKYFNWWTLVLLLILFSGAVWFYFNYHLNYLELAIVALLGSSFTINLAFLVSTTTLGNLIRVLGSHSLYIFLMHSMAAAFIRIIFTRVFGLQIPELLLLFCTISGCVIPIIAYNLMARFHLWILFTPDNPGKEPKFSGV